MISTKLGNIASFYKTSTAASKFGTFLFGRKPPLSLLVNDNASRNISTSVWLAAKKKKKKCKGPALLMDPKCKVGIVTGGATGIGYAATCHLLCEGAEHVIIAGINRKEGQDAIYNLNCKFGKDRVCYMHCDVSNECDFDNLFKQAIKSFGYVDILFNNAGMLEDRQWSKTIDVNIKGVLIGNLLAFKYMGKDYGGKGGVVVNNASILGFDHCAGAPVYTSTKHAVIGLTKALGDEYHHSRNCVRTASLCPGVTVTELVTSAYDRQLTDDWGQETKNCLDSLPVQDVGVTGAAFMYIVRHGLSGHHYVIEGCELFQVCPPPRQTYSKLLCSYK